MSNTVTPPIYNPNPQNQNSNAVSDSLPWYRSCLNCWIRTFPCCYSTSKSSLPKEYNSKVLNTYTGTGTKTKKPVKMSGNIGNKGSYREPLISKDSADSSIATLSTM